MSVRPPHGTGECKLCKRWVRTEDLALVHTGGTVAVTWDKRPKTHTGWRIGEPRWGRAELPEAYRVCSRCRGTATPEPTPSLHKQAQAAWEELRGSMDPELRRMALRRTGGPKR